MTIRAPRLSVLSINVLDPLDNLGVTHLTKVSLCGGQVRVPEDHLADDLKRCTGPGCIGCRMSSEIVRTQLDTDQTTGLFHNVAGCRVLDWEYPILTTEFRYLNIAFEAIGHLLRDENHL